MEEVSIKLASTPSLKFWIPEDLAKFKAGDKVTLTTLDNGATELTVNGKTYVYDIQPSATVELVIAQNVQIQKVENAVGFLCVFLAGETVGGITYYDPSLPTIPDESEEE